MPLSKIQTTNNQVVPNLGRRNIIINGAMQLAQRQGGALTVGVNNTYCLDRWKFYLNGSCAASTQKLPATDSNVSSLHTASGQTFSNVMSIDCTTAATLGSTDLLGVLQLIEGANSVPLAGRSCTLSFYVKTNVTGQYYVTFKIGSGRAYIAPYTVSSANTWEKKTITLTMDTLANLNTSGSIATGAGFQVYFGLRLGTSGQMSNTLNAWHAGNYYGKSDQVTWGTNTADTFYMSGVQLEIGDTATDFEHRSFGEEEALCQRYFETGTFSQRISGTLVRTGQSYMTTKRSTATVNVYYDSNKAAAGTINISNSADAGWAEGGNVNFWNMEKNTGSDHNGRDYNGFFTAEAEL